MSIGVHRGRQGRPIRVALAAIALGCFAGLLVACSNILDSKNTSPNILDQVNSVDLQPRFPAASAPGTADRGHDPKAAVFPGSENAQPFNTAVQGAEPAASGDGYDLNFENAPVTTVAKVILGDILGVGYVIDPRVQGTVTLQSGRPVPKSDIAFVLESALRVSNIALVRSENAYRLVPSPDAIGTGQLDANGQVKPGYGVSVVPLRYVSAATLTKLVENFAAKQGAVRVDATRNMLLIQGTGPERRSAVQTVLSFDADWMRGQSIGIYPVKHATPEPIISELEKILDSGEGGLGRDLIKLQPIGRLNAILVVASKPALLETAAMWIRRLDNSEISTTGVKVYRVRYGEARHLARVLNDMFAGISAGTSLESTSNQLAPGAETTTTTSGPAQLTPVERLTGGPTQRAPGATATEVAPAASQRTPGATRASTGGSILPGLRITADVVNNSLLVYANEENYAIILKALQQLDRPPLQVAFDATIAEVTLNDSLTYGVQFFLKSQNVGAPPDSGSAINSIGGAVLSRVLPGFNLLVGSENSPQAILDALHSVTDVKILSNPSLVVVDNGVATLQVGDQVPITTGTATVLSSNNAVVNTINYQNTGIILRVTPRVSANGNVTLDIEQEISNVSDTNNTGVLTPTISERKVKSTLNVADGQTVMLAGLVSETQNKTRNGMPWLDQLPGYLGDAFSHQNKTIQRTELVIFIRPQIIRDAVDAHLIAEDMRAKMKARVGTITSKPPLLPPPVSAR